MLVGHVADAHLGRRQYNLEERERDIYEAFQEACTKLSDKGIEMLLLSGDIFDVSRPPNRALKFFQETIGGLLDDGVKVYAISGDHDTPKRSDVPPLMLFEKMGVKYLWSRKPCLAEGDVTICGVQNFPRSGEKAFRETLRKLQPPGEMSVLMLHQGLKPFFRFGEFDSSILPAGFSYYAMGHIHEFIVKKFRGGALVYPGSIEVMDISEIASARRGEKGPVLFDLDRGPVDPASVIKLPLTSIRPQVVVRVKGVYNYDVLVDAIEAEIERIKGDKAPVVHVEAEELPPRSLEEKLRKRFSGKVLVLRFKRIPKAEETLVEDLGSSIDVEEILREMLNNPRVVSLARELLETLGKAGDTKRALEAVKKYYYEEVNRNAT